MNYIIKDGKSEYKILLPKNFTEKEQHAASELRNFLNEVGGCMLEITTDEKSAEKSIALITEEKGEDSFTIITDGDNYRLIGDSGRATIYAAYAFLRKTVGLEFFTHEFYLLGKKGDVPFVKINLTAKPDIPARALGIAPLHSEKLGDPFLPMQYRMGLRGMGEGWGLKAHTYFIILPPKIYKEKHPDWYFEKDGRLSLCLSNAEMRKEFIKRLKERILEYPTAKYFNLGQEDGNDYCLCPECLKKEKEYGGSRSLMMLEFVNSVVKEINPWLKEEQNGREIIFGTFAYNYTIVPPARKTPKGFESLCPFKLEDNIAVMLAPLNVRADIPYTDEENLAALHTCYNGTDNVKMADIIGGWESVCKRFFIWTYCADYSDALTPINHWQAISDNFKEFKRIGAEYVFVQGIHTGYAPVFNALRIYVFSNLLWNVDIDVDLYTERFFLAYYGSAAMYMKRYFDFINSVCDEMYTAKDRPQFHVRFDDYSDSTAPEYWSLDDLRRAEELLEKAMDSAKGIYKIRAEEEGLCIRYIMLIRYSYALQDEEQLTFAKKVVDLIDKYSLDKTPYFVKENLNKIRNMLN